MIKIALGALFGAALVFAAVTFVALESSDVAIVETLRADGTTRATHVWFIEEDGVVWLEAGTPENGWYVDVQRNPTLAFRAEGRDGEFVAHPLPGDRARHGRLREQLRGKYGWRDAWVSVYVDQSRSLAVRLDPAR
jgi:hypothetical protein